MAFWSAIFSEAREGLTGYIFLALFVILVLARLLALPERRLLKGTVWLFGLHLAMVPVAAGFRYFGSDLYREIRLVCRILSAICVVQMAVFLVRSKHGASYSPPGVGAGTGFTDVPPTYWAATWIKQLVIEGITSGCGNGNYCPEDPVTRAQMAVFLVKTFNLP